MRRESLIILLLYYSSCNAASEYLSLPEGSNCTWNGGLGKCVPIYKCLTAEENIKNNTHPPICAFNGKEPIICCTDCELQNDTRKILMNHNLGFLQLTGEKVHDKCLYYEHLLPYDCKTKYKSFWWYLFDEEKKCVKKHGFSLANSPVGGEDAKRGEFPHMALLGYGSDPLSLLWLCGGSLISRTFILTAGHCISQPKYGSVTYVGLGMLRRTDPLGLWQKHRVKRIVPHPEYKSPSKYNDIALLETGTPVIYNRYVLPACIVPTEKRRTDIKINHSATGWGTLGHRKPLADVLQVVQLEEFTEEECKKEYKPHRNLLFGYNHTTQMCFGSRDQVIDTCEGDSGGPLQQNYETCLFTLMGVTSHGRACGVSAGAGMYTRVSYYVPWIESVVWPGDGPQK